jgi:hypothetical protein
VHCIAWNGGEEATSVDGRYDTHVLNCIFDINRSVASLFYETNVTESKSQLPRYFAGMNRKGHLKSLSYVLLVVRGGDGTKER